jgi:hypothetical protein
MSRDWVKDINDMHAHYGFHKAVGRMSAKELAEYLDFRIKFLYEELKELRDADTPNDAIDALIDLVVVAIGTLDAFDVNAYQAWDKVHEANMNKQVGVKESRPNPLGLPDLIKPEGWTAPDHSDSRSLLDFVYLEKWSDKK